MPMPGPRRGRKHPMKVHALAIPGVHGLVAVLLLWGLAGSAVPARGQPAPPADWRFTPLVETIVSPPRWFSGSDGQVHLVHELLLTNALPGPATVSTVAVIDAESGATLLGLSGPSLLAAMSLVTSPDSPKVVLPTATVGAVWLDVPLT